MQLDQQQAETALAEARSALDQGNLPEADAICQQLLIQNPRYAPARHLSSLLRYREGKQIEAIEQMMHAVELDPERASWLNDLGNLLAAHHQPDQAARFFQHALRLEPENAIVWNNLGAMRVKLDQQQLAGEAFEQAVTLDEALVDAWANYANWLSSQGRAHDAAECVLRAFVAAPPEGQPMVMRGMALARLGRLEEAATCFQAHLAEHPQDPTAQHLYHACAGDATPERAADEYIRDKYASCADNFDAHQAGIGHRGSALIETQVDAVCGSGLSVLDAGCGTGLAGARLVRHCASLTGVDLSDAMLERARQHGIYQALECQEITTYLPAHSDQFDLIVAAELLVYFGTLTTFCTRARDALRAGGRLVATLEAAADHPDSFELQANGRYRHGERYIAQSLSAAGFDQIEIRGETLYLEGEKEVAGWLVSARKSAG